MKEKTQRKMFRIGEIAHSLAKPIAAIEGIYIQEYIDNLIIDDTEKRYPHLIDGLEKKDIENQLKEIANSKGMTFEELVDAILLKYIMAKS